MRRVMLANTRWLTAKRATTRRALRVDYDRVRCEPLEARCLLAGDLVAHWVADSLNDSLADGAVVATWSDRVASTTATAEGSPKLVMNQLSGHSALRFNATDGLDVLRVPGAASPLTGATDFSVAVVFVTSSTDLEGSITNGWFDNTGLVDANRLGLAKDWGLVITEDGHVGGGVGGGFGQPHHSIYSSAAGLNNGDFHMAVLTRSGDTLSIYVNDNPANSLAGVSSTARDRIDIAIGALQTGGKGFTGDILEVRLYNGALTEEQVGNLYVEITSTYRNSAPVGVDDSYTLDEDPILFFQPADSGVLANDIDAEGDALEAVLISQPQHGTLTLNADGSFLYDPETNFFGVDGFTYAAVDSQTSDPTRVTLNVRNVYDPAVAVADSYKSIPGQALSVSAAEGVLANDANPDQVSLRALLETNVTRGSLVLNQDGSFQYNPQGFAGTTTFSYRIHDGTALSTPTTVTLVINSAPVARNDVFDVTEDTVLSLTATSGILANDVDAERNPLTVTLVDGPQHGSLTLNENGSLVYTPELNYAGPDLFTYRLSDGYDPSDTATVQLNVRAVDDAPVPVADVFYTAKDQTVSVAANSGVLANDTDVDSAQLQAQLVTNPANGTLQLRQDGSFTYQPKTGFSGTDRFTYRASDGPNSSDPISVTLYVGVSPVQISEVLVANVSSIKTRVRTDPAGSFGREVIVPDWIELKNLTTAPFDLGGFALTDDSDRLSKWTFPSGTTIPAGGYLLVFATRLNITDPALDEQGVLHTNFRLRPEGEYLAIVAPDGAVVDALAPQYPKQRPDISYGRRSDGQLGYFLSVTPGADNSATYAGVVADTSFSVDRGFYDQPIQVAITTRTEGAQIRYTLDGSVPTATTGQVYTGPITISTTANLRAAAFRDGYVPSNVDAQTYIFPADVLKQDGSGLTAARWGHAGPDWEMDPEIVNNPDPEVRVVPEDLKRIPTVSLTFDWEQMFGNGGIYIRGENDERPVSFEFFDPARGDHGVQANGTVQIVGGSSPQRWKTDRLSLRVRFTEDQGVSSLEYPLFDDPSAVTSFETIAVDAHLNNVWTYGGGSEPTGQRGRAQYMRDEYASDLQRAMGGNGVHNQHVHLYLNGLYWGLITLHERPDDNFAASYLGGFNTDYDAMKHRQTTVVAGSADKYRELHSLARADLTVPENYQAVGNLLDVDDFINYMLMNFYGGNEDWAHQNWYATYNRVDPNGKWRYHSWDAEKVLQNVNVNVTGKNDDGGPTALHQRLTRSEEYRLQFADWVYKHMFNNGVLTPENTAELYLKRSNEIESAIRAESARWGDNQRAQPYTRLDWLRNRDSLINTYFPRRTGIVLNQLRSRNLWVGDDRMPPQFVINGTAQHGGFAAPGSSLTMTSPPGTIWYTTDGSDPRLEGGQVSGSAIQYNGALPVNQGLDLKARLVTPSGEWSPLAEASFTVNLPADASSLRISEIHYHPADPTPAEIAAGHNNADDFEFIELVNISNTAIDLSGVQFRKVVVGNEQQSVNFDFAGSTIRELKPGQFVLVVEDVDAFAARYGANLPVAGQWEGRLGNATERIVLFAGDTIIHDFSYSDEWYALTDGRGYSLTHSNPSDPNLASWGQSNAWKVSGRFGGTPGASDVASVPGDSNHDGIFNSSDLVKVFQAGEYEDSIAGNSTFEEGDWNGDGDFTTSDLVFVFQAGTYSQNAETDTQWPQLAAALNDPSVYDRAEQQLAVRQIVAGGLDPSPRRLQDPQLAARESLFSGQLLFGELSRMSADGELEAVLDLL